MTRRCRCHPYRAQGAGAAITGMLLLLAVIGWRGVAVLVVGVLIIAGLILEEKGRR